MLEILRRMFGQLSPRQRMSETGHGNVQAGSVGRDLTNVTIIQTVTVAAPLPSIQANPSGLEAVPATRTNGDLQPVLQPQGSIAVVPATVPTVSSVVPQATLSVDRDTATLRRELFDLLEKFDKTPDRRVIVLNWMDQQFGTKRVVELDRNQLLRTVRWSSVVLKDRRRKRAERGTVIR
ncbi:hypothetical protein [Burkholderia orbicola]|uniref:hypothetical protein n=1 Tax=Burkholderia orbicola TaxID=2978683 RepID=UPI0026552BA1|nr:hypothetical protein [Burkholderia orbicola]MDN7533840.1 hypothetical protein [Burkholderia orbicola]